MRSECIADEGSGTPIVYVPGIDGTGRMLLGGAARIASEFRLLRLRYVAGDDASSDRYETLAAGVLGVLDERDVRQALLLAESFGVAVALQAALDGGDRVGGLMLVNGFPYYRRRLRLWLSRRLAPLLPDFLFHLGRGRCAPFALFGRLREPDAIRAFRAEVGMTFGRAYRRRLNMIAGVDLRPRLSEIACPVTIVAGACDRVVDSTRQAEVMAELLPGVEVRVVDGGGHLLLPLAQLPWTDWLRRLADRAKL